MDRTTVTLFDFFSPEKGLCQKQLARLQSDESMSKLKTVMAGTGINWAPAFQKIIEKADDLLNIGIDGILINAWNKYQILLKYLDSEKYPSNEAILVPMFEHTVKSEHHPCIDVLIQNISVYKLDFAINFSLTLKSVVLKIQAGKVMEIMPSNCKGKGSFKCKGLLVLEKETQQFSLPLSISLGNGVPIAPG